ncbi:outer membrane protein assembly factor BamE [uncultured Roseobacter sp.]|uniref:outer membrane protein assembly factor BamE n=1 Tax=uncultured Roseobacter sp. TaxID=114847 RepID=UPI00260291C9|nr:outer membrane protein assembly factor BamE [uncultured Roseobacter sp.]
MGITKAIQAWGPRAAVALLCLAVSACASQFREHGYIPPPEDLEQIVVGIDTRASVQETLGSAGARSVTGDSGMYFVRSRFRTFAMLEPEVVEREVLAISFDQNDVVTNLETFGLERGQVVPLTRRVTSSSVRDSTFLRQLFGNIGRFTPTGSGGGGLGL